MTEIADQNRFAPPRAAVADVAEGQGQVLASRWSRLWAAIVDSLLVGGTLLAASFALPGLLPRADAFGVVPWTQMLLGFAIYLAINGWLLHTQGQTVGKKLLGLRIVRSDGSAAPLARLAGLRFGATLVWSMIPVVGQLVGMLDALLIFRDSRKCLHDNIADTIVVTAASSVGPRG